MALLTLDGHGVIRGVLSLPRLGVWRAELDVDVPEALTGAVTLKVGDDALTLKGTVSTGGEHQGINRVRVVGGADGLRRLARPQHYVRPTVRIVAADLLRTAGEAGLSSTIAEAVAGRQLAAWTTIANSVGEQLAALVDRGAPTDVAWGWRVLPDGTLWLGPETWPATEVADWRELEESPQDRRLEIGLDMPALLPGTMLGERKVDYVEHHISAGEIRSRVWWT
jgi:hypothetical protein